MKSKVLVLLAGLLFLGFAAPARQAQAAVSVGVSVVSGRGLSLSFSSHPDFGLIPGSRVYYGRDIDRDVYCYGDDWYYVDQDAWYEGPSYRGPFVQVSFSSVPYEIRSVPGRYRRRWSDSNYGGGYSGYGYGGGYNSYGYGGGYPSNRGGYSDRNSTWNNQRDRGTWSQNNQNNQRDRGSWSQNRDGDFRQREVTQQQYRDRNRWASGGWNRDWRNDRRYDWRDYRERHRSIFRIGIYYDPFGYGYRSFDIGYRLYPNYYGQQYWIDPGMYSLPFPPPGTQWVRYWNDALLVDMYTGEVVDVIHGFFW